MDKLIKKLKEVYKNRNWEEDSKEIEKIVSQFDDYICQPIEYNTDTSAGHPIKDDDIVRYSEETQRVQDKELEY